MIYHGDPHQLAAPRPSLTPELLRFIEAHFGLHASQPLRDLGGSFNLNVLIDGHVVCVYGPWVSPRRVAAIQRVRETLRQRGIPIPSLRPGLDDLALTLHRLLEGGSTTCAG